jgi:class 3 adenylate cyclase/predicted ATPase
MFCDLVGSTPLALELDPEDLLETMASYQSAVAMTAERFGGYIARCFGDGVLIYFGWPQADETDAERAVRAGLAIVEAVHREIARGENLRVRIGIASGVVIIGDVIGPDAVREQAVVGAAPNLASRLQALADPDTVVIAETTRTQIGGLFTCEDLGIRRIKGYAEPVRAWRVRSNGGVQNRFQALRGSKQTPLIGRDEELDLLVRQWHQTKNGKGSVVLIAGDAGIGKSRLVAAMQEQLHGEVYTRLQLFCGPDQRDSALHPVIGHIEHAIDPIRKATAGEKLRALRALLARTDASQEDVTLFADMLSFPHEELPTLNLSPQRRREKTFEALNRHLQRLAWQRPVLMVVEDVHWSDPTTLELLDLTIDAVHNLPALLVVTFRPDFRPRWQERPGLILIKLERLDRLQAATLIAGFEGSASLPDGLVDRIVAGSDGVPLFVEELTKAALEKVSLQQGGKAAASLTLALPTTLEALLMARLDRFPAAKEVARIAAVIGREFSHRLLAGVAQLPDSVLLKGLEQLIAAELIFPHGAVPDAHYTFKHALLQDAAYETLLRSQRAALHARLVEVLLEQNPDVEERHPGLLGHHCAHAGKVEEAAAYYRRAGERSAERAALAETRGHLERGLALIAALPDREERAILEVELKLALGRVLLSTQGNADIEAGNAFEEAVVLCRGLNRVELRTRALWGWWFNLAHRRKMASAETAAQELRQLGERHGAPQIVACTMLGITRFWQGRFEEARLHLQSALDLFRIGERPAVDLAIVSDNLEIHAAMQLSLTLACLGSLKAAARLAARASAKVTELAHLPSRAIVLAVKCRHDWFVRNEQSLQRSAAALIELAQEQAFPFYLSLGRCHLGWLAAKRGSFEEGLNLLRTGLGGLQLSDAAVWEPYLRGMMAEALIWAGHASEAQQIIDRALELSAESGSIWFDAELHRCKGEALLIGGLASSEAAEACFRRAIAISQHQSAKLWELRASARLAQLWRDQGKHTEASVLLRG